MALPLTVSDFKLRQVICELRYPDAFLVFDRTGDIYHHLGKKFTNLHSDSASPVQTQMTADEGIAVVELNALRFSRNDPDSKLEQFSMNSKILFELAVEKLDLSVFTRIGLRQIFTKSYGTAAEPKSAVNALKLLSIGTEKRFGIEHPNVSEFLIRWEDKQLGTILRLTAQSGRIDAQFPLDLGMAESSVHKEVHHLILDVDYYTLAPVERGQWDAATWITQSARIVQRDADRILSK